MGWGRPQSAVRAFNQGVNHFNDQDFNAAVPYFDQAIASDPEFVDALHARGACKYYLKSFESAQMDLNEALRLRPGYRAARSLRGAILYETDHWDDALNDFNAVLLQDPTDSQSLLGRGVIRLRREELTGAGRDFQRFLAHHPDDPIAPQVRQILRRMRPAEQELDAERPAGGSARQISHDEIEEMAARLQSNPVAETYQDKVLRGEKAEAVGGKKYVPGSR